MKHSITFTITQVSARRWVVLGVSETHPTLRSDANPDLIMVRSRPLPREKAHEVKSYLRDKIRFAIGLPEAENPAPKPEFEFEPLWDLADGSHH